MLGQGPPAKKEEKRPDAKDRLSLLPDDLLPEIFSLPEDIASIGSVSKSLRAKTSNAAIWKKKVEQHFPRVFNNLLSEPLDWYKTFREAYADEYKGLPSRIRRLFSIIKEGKIEHLKTAGITLDDLDKIDKNYVSLLEHAQRLKNQPVLDYIYTIAQKKFPANSSGMPHFSVLCHQDNGHDFYEKRHLFIHIAARAGHLNTVKALIKRDPTLLSDRSGCTPLIRAASQGHLPVVKYLLEQKEINLKTDGRDALYWALQGGHCDVVGALLRHHDMSPAVLASLPADLICSSELNKMVGELPNTVVMGDVKIDMTAQFPVSSRLRNFFRSPFNNFNLFSFRQYMQDLSDRAPHQALSIIQAFSKRNMDQLKTALSQLGTTIGTQLLQQAIVPPEHKAPLLRTLT